MNVDEMIDKLNKIDNNLRQENKSLIHITKNIANLTDDEQIKQDYYDLLPEYEKNYQKENDEYKKLISGFSKAYLEISNFYVGENLPRQTFLASNKDMSELCSLFLFSAIAEPYINAYYNKYCV